MKKLFFIVLFFVVSALTSTSTALAETATSGNLLPNTGNQACTNNQFGSGNGPAGVGCSGSSSNLSQGGTTNQGFDVRSGTGKDWGTGGTKDIESNGNITIGDAGSLENITVTKQNGGTTTTTADMLDGGVTLKSTTEQQNCEWQSSSYKCGSSAGAQDSFTVKVEIKDATGNVLATVEQTRNTDAGYNSNTAIHQDSVTYTGEGSRNYDWQWTGTDGNNPNATTGLQGPNLIGAALEMTIANIDYSPQPPISEETQEEIEEANEAIEEVEEIIENIPIEEVVNGVEEVQIETPSVEVETIEEPTVEIEEQAFQESFQENFTAILEEEGLQETFEEALVEEGITEEQFFEAVTEMVTEEFATSTEEEPTVEEPTVEEETPTESVNTTEESVETETESATETETPESETSSETSTESNTQETESETESTGSETESEGTTESESSEQEESTSDGEESMEDSGEESANERESDTDTSVDEVEVETQVGDITAKVEKILKKLESKLTTLDQKLKVVSLVTQQAMIEDQPDMSAYTQMQFYDTRKMSDNPDWYAESTILEAYNKSIYTDKTLIAYQQNDPMFVYEQELNRVNNNVSQLEAELEVLRNENNR
jgi:hypothetical protein